MIIWPRKKRKEVAPQAAPKSLGAAVAVNQQWSPDRTILDWSQFDKFTLRNAVEHILLLGEIGAAKSTGSGANFLLPFMSLGMGGVITCVKPGDRAQAEYFARLAGCAHNLVVIAPDQPWRFNLLRYALLMKGIVGSRTDRVMGVLQEIAESLERREQGRGDGTQKFWEQAKRTLLRNAIEIIVRGTGTISMQAIDEFISSLPRSRQEISNKQWQEKSYCNRVSEAAQLAEMTPRERKDLDHAVQFFYSDFVDTPAETRGSILATYRVMADVLLRGQMAELFDTTTNFVPEMTFDGAIVVLDLPVKVYGDAGLIMQSAFLHLWQIAVEQRVDGKKERPIFCYIDEAHELISDKTPRFLATARSSNCAVILISQNLSNLRSAFGSSNAAEIVDGIASNTATKIFHANGHHATNKWASDTISEELIARANWNGSREAGKGNAGASEQIGAKVLPAEFTMMKKGGPQNGFMTQAIVYQTGAAFLANNGEPFIRTTFRQYGPGIVWE